MAYRPVNRQTLMSAASCARMFRLGIADCGSSASSIAIGRRLKALPTRSDALAGNQQRERNRQEANNFNLTPESVSDSMTWSIAFLEAELTGLEKMITSHVNDDPGLRGRKDLPEIIPGVDTGKPYDPEFAMQGLTGQMVSTF